MDELGNACQEGGKSGKSFDGVERARAEIDAAPIVGNQNRWSVRGVPSRYELRAKGKPGRCSRILCTRWHGPSNDQNAEMRIWKIFACDISGKNYFIRSMRTVLRLLRLKYHATARSEALHHQGSVYEELFHKSGTGVG